VYIYIYILIIIYKYITLLCYVQKLSYAPVKLLSFSLSEKSEVSQTNSIPTMS
jgi:hypothetical protein